jgi:adenine-specific DNA-methyltransferase
MAKETKPKNAAKRPIEQYDHKKDKRLNNPPVGLVTPETDKEEPKKKYSYDPHLDPQLVWAGKKERTSFEVPSVSLHVHERIDPRTIIEAVKRKNGGPQMSLFQASEENPPLREAIEFYKHRHNWSNRLIAGDSLLVMNSMIEKEGMAGQVQMVYFDPPYGIRYGSNFQAFVNRRDVKDGKDEDLTQEPEMVKAFRDTWELGIHSYLTYMRDRLLLIRDLLSESGSVFVQISDENVHAVRSLLHEVFGAANYVVTIILKKKGGQKGGMMDPINDYILWCTKNKEVARTTFRKVFVPIRDEELADVFRYVELPDGRELTLKELSDETGYDYRRLPRRVEVDFPGAKLFASENLTSGGFRRTQSVVYVYKGVEYDPGIAKGNCWKHSAITDDGSSSGMDRLAQAGRLFVGDKQLRFKRYASDFGYSTVTNLWDEFGGATDPIYVVQTNVEVVKRCMLMTTDPGQLVACRVEFFSMVSSSW